MAFTVQAPASFVRSAFGMVSTLVGLDIWVNTGVVHWYEIAPGIAVAVRVIDSPVQAGLFAVVELVTEGCGGIATTFTATNAGADSQPLFDTTNWYSPALQVVLLLMGAGLQLNDSKPQGPVQ